MSDWRLGHRPSLDGLRGVAVLLVLAGHFGVPWLPAGGTVGVTLFFVLSGYLITALLLCERADRGSVDLRAFYVRRARRLLPALALLLLAVGAWATLTGRLGEWLPDAASVVLYVGNWRWLDGHQLTGIAHAWSLAVEEQFYIVWPLLLLALGRRALPIALILITASFAATVVFSGDYARSLYGSDVRVKDLLTGAVIAMVSMRRGADLRVPTWAAIAAAGVLAVIAWNPSLGPLGTTVPCGILVAWFTARPSVAAWRPLTFTGRISYGLYLFHFPLEAGPFAAFDGLSLWPRVVALTATSYLFAVASWYNVERRFLRRRRDRGVLGGVGIPRPEGEDWAGRGAPREAVG